MRLATSALCALALGCAGELEDPQRFTSCPPGFVEDLLVGSCGGSGCHGDREPAADLDLVSSGVEARLVGEVSTSELCEGKLRVDPEADEPTDHLLIDKLREQPSCGARMPFGTTALSAGERECIERWVDEMLGGGGGES